MLAFLLFLHLPLFGSVPGADRVALSQVRKLTIEGLHYLYDLDVERANQKFDEAIAVNGSHPRPYVSRAMAPLWTFFATKSQSDYEEAVHRATKAIEVAEESMEDFRKSARGAEMRSHYADVLASLGTAYGFRSFAHAHKKNYLKAAWDAKKGYDFFRDAVKADSTFYDAYLWLGMIHFAIGTIPKPLQWIVSMLGIEGNRDGGIREMELAAVGAIYSSVEAKYYLAQFYPWYSGDFEASERILEDILKRYPRNTVFMYARGYLALRRNNIETALPYFLRIKEIDNPYFPSFTRFADLRIGDCYFRLGDYTRGREALVNYLALSDQNLFQSMASYYAGLASELLGDRAAAIKFYERARNAEAAHGDDLYASRHAARLLTSPLSTVDSLLIKAKSAHKCGRYGHAVRLYGEIVERKDISEDRRAEAVYGMGESLFEMAKYNDAAQRFRSVLRLQVTSEHWVYPWSRFMLAQIALKRNDRAAARRDFERVLEYESYDHRNWLAFRAQQELERMAYQQSE